jgi:hypothetical protein
MPGLDPGIHSAAAVSANPQPDEIRRQQSGAAAVAV